jgi:thioredoxin-like negative regulator of GroEL
LSTPNQNLPGVPRSSTQPQVTRPGNRPGSEPNVADRSRERNRSRFDRDRDNRNRAGDPRRDGRPSNLVERDGPSSQNRISEQGRGGARNAQENAARRYTARYRSIDRRPEGYRDFVSRNFNSNGSNNNFNQNPWQYRSGNYWAQNYGNDWRQSNWHRNFGGSGYANRFSPWWGVVPGLGYNWGGWGYGWGWPQWGWGYSNWGGYGYGYGDYNSYYGDAPAQQVTVLVTPEQAQLAQDYYGDALIAFQDARYQDSIRLCQHAMVDNPRSAEVILLLAQALFATGEFEQATDAIQMAVQVLPESQWGIVVKNYATNYPNMADYTDQLRALEAAAKTNPAVNTLLGYQYGFLGHYPQAVAQLDGALDTRADDVAAQELRRLFAASAGLAARAPAPAQDAPVAAPAIAENQPSNDPQSVISIAPPSAEQMESAADYVVAGEQEFKVGQYAKAAQFWQHAMVDDPRNGAVLLLMSQSLFAQGNYRDAAGATQMAMQALPESEWGNVIQKRADIYGNPDEYMAQLKSLEQAKVADPNDPSLHFLLGFHYGWLGQKEQALGELDKTLELQPQDEGARKIREVLAAASGTPAQ